VTRDDDARDQALNTLADWLEVALDLVASAEVDKSLPEIERLCLEAAVLARSAILRND
jgi:hypothetical protein